MKYPVFDDVKSFDIAIAKKGPAFRKGRKNYLIKWSFFDLKWVGMERHDETGLLLIYPEGHKGLGILVPPKCFQHGLGKANELLEDYPVTSETQVVVYETASYGKNFGIGVEAFDHGIMRAMALLYGSDRGHIVPLPVRNWMDRPPVHG